MKKIPTAIAAATFSLLSVPAFSAYIIHLHDGTKFVTDQYYEQGDQIKFKRYGGVIGIQKDRVFEIVETDTPAEPPAKKEPPAEPAPAPAAANAENQETPEDTTRPQAPQEGTQDAISKSEEVVSNQEEQKADKKIDVERYKKEKTALLQKKEAAMQKYKKGGEYGDNEMKAQAKRELREIYNELSKLASALRQENEGVLPPWWYQIDEDIQN